MQAPPSFYEGDTLEVAKKLLGQKLVHIVDGIKRSGIIVEVEAYKGPVIRPHIVTAADGRIVRKSCLVRQDMLTYI